MVFAKKGFKQYLLFLILIVGIIPLVSGDTAAKNETYQIGIHIWKSGKIYDEALQGIRDGLKLQGFSYKEVLFYADKDKKKAIDNFNKLDNMNLDIIFM